MPVSHELVDGRRRLLVSRTVDAPTETVWEILTDTDLWPEWGPSVAAVDTPTRYIESGTSGRIRTPVGLTLPFEITTFEQYRWEWEVARIPATGHRVEPLDDRRCRVSFELSPLAAGYIPVCKRALDRIAALATN